MEVAFGGGDAGMSKQVLDEFKGGTVFEEMGGEGMAEDVDSSDAVDIGFFTGAIEDGLEGAFVEGSSVFGGFEKPGGWSIGVEVGFDDSFQRLRQHYDA